MWSMRSLTVAALLTVVMLCLLLMVVTHVWPVEPAWQAVPTMAAGLLLAVFAAVAVLLSRQQQSALSVRNQYAVRIQEQSDGGADRHAGAAVASGVATEGAPVQPDSEVLHAMPDGYMRVDADGRLLDVNQAYCEIVGYSAPQLLTMNLQQLEHSRGEDQEPLHRRVAAAAARGGARFEARQRRQDNQVIDLEVTVLPKLDSSAGLIVLLRDISELRRIEQSLRLRSAAVDAATDGIVICSADEGCPVIYMNPATERITGYSEQELLGRNLRHLEGEESDPVVSDRLRQAIQDGTEFEGEVVNYRRDGEKFWNRLHVTPIHNQAGELTWFIGILTDVTRSRKADFALRESEAMLRSVTQSATDFIVLTDLQGEVLFINRTFPTLSVEKVVGTSIFDYVPTDSITFVRSIHERVVETLEPESYELAYRHEEDEVTLLESIVSPIVRFGEVIGLTISSRDVTTQRRLQKQLERSQRLASLGTLAGGIAHEINNPMAAAWTAADAAKRFLQIPGQEDMLAECLEAVGSSVQRCQVIIENVLRVARRQNSIKEPSDVNLVVESAIEMMRQNSPPGTSFSATLQATLPRCVINKDEIQQVLVNLIRNALQSGTDVDVSITTQTVDEAILVRVADNGSGIEEADLKQIFDPFFTTRGGTDGTGLGLAICHAIIEDHGGLIDVQSQVGRGTTVAISLPLVSGTPEPAD